MLTRFIAIAAFALSVATTSHANVPPPPTGDPILTVTGDIDVMNQGDAFVLDYDTLMAMGVETIQTTTIWTDGLQTFEGVPLFTLAEQLGVTDGTFFATAINDYTVEIPVSDAVEGGPIIAVLLNGEQMSIRDKGPLWIIYPYDKAPEYRTEVIYSRSIWQLDRIEVAR